MTAFMYRLPYLLRYLAISREYDDRIIALFLQAQVNDKFLLRV